MAGSHRHYLNPLRPDRLITFAWHPGDVPRSISADIVDDLGITRDKFQMLVLPRVSVCSGQ